MSQGHVNRGMMLVKAMKKADRAAFFEEVADTFCIDCGEQEPDDDHEDTCPEAEPDDEEDDGDELVFDVIEAAKEAVDGGKKVEGGVLVPEALMQDLGEAIEALKVAEDEDEDESGDEGDPDEDEDEDEDEDGDEEGDEA